MAVVETSPLSEREQERMVKLYPALFKESVFIRTNPGKCVLPEAYLDYKECLKNWRHRSGDVYVCGFPKTGTTWMQDLAWCIQNDCNLERYKTEFVYERSRFIEAIFQFDKVKQTWPDAVKALTELRSMQMLPEPRVYKTHLPFCLYPDNLLDNSKVVLCLRNPKDVLVSYYHHEKLFSFCGFVGDFSTYFDLFMDDMLQFCPYFDYYVEAWQKLNHPNLCTIFYEDMKDDFVGGVKKMAKFLGKVLSDEEVSRLASSLNFKQMKQDVQSHWNKEILFTSKDGNFFRKGTVGDWKEYFTEDMNRRMDEKVGKYFKPIGLEFKYE